MKYRIDNETGSIFYEDDNGITFEVIIEQKYTVVANGFLFVMTDDEANVPEYQFSENVPPFARPFEKKRGIVKVKKLMELYFEAVAIMNNGWVNEELKKKALANF